MKPYILEEREKGYLLFTINRPEKRNAVNYEIIDGLNEAVQKASDSKARALVITGAGDKAFCSGGDLSVFHQLRSDEEAYGMLSKMGRVLTDLLLLPIPTIALINGTAVGGGCELASACDFRIARQGVKAGFVQGKLAITTGWGGGTMILEKMLPANGLKMLLEAELYDTEVLKELGFLHHVYQEEHTSGLERFIERFLKIDRGVLAAYKEISIRKWLESDIAARIDAEIRQCAELWAREEHHNQVAKFNNKK
nr:enoyl-CoA hydratase/isomerase family protein [uncultured Bacillus sp.]